MKSGGRAHTGTAFLGSAQGHRTTGSSAGILGDIERVGWRLEHTGYFYMVTGETSTKKVLISGDQTAVTGITFGVYLFRRASPAERQATSSRSRW